MLIASALGVAVIAAFVVWEARTDHPMVDIGVFRYGGVSAGGLALVANMMMLSATLFLVPLYLQSVRGISAIAVGLLFIPFGATFTVVALLAGSASRRYGVRGLALGVAVAGTVLASIYTAELAPALSRPSWADAAVADASINGAHTVAARMSSGASDLLDAADVAFVTGYQSALLLLAGMVVVVAAVAVVLLRPPHASATRETDESAAIDTGAG